MRFRNNGFKPFGHFDPKLEKNVAFWVLIAIFVFIAFYLGSYYI